jgi:cytochrome c-type biogenesis protein CcmF
MLSLEAIQVLINLGYFSLVLTFLVALYGVFAAVYGTTRKKAEFVESARHAMLATWPLMTVSVLALLWLLVNGQFQIRYVYSTTNIDMPFYLKITALWGGQPGSLVFWSWLMAAFASAASLRKWDRERELLPWVIAVTLVTLAFFLSLSIFFENPFARLWRTSDGQQVTAMFQPPGTLPFVPADGRGLNPLLRHIGMVIHPPMQYLGFVSFVIPYALAIAALITGRTDDRWIRISRRWTLIAWVFLSMGLILGSWWAYYVLGWGGYWGWDPVEISGLIPWLCGTAFLHSVMIHEKRGMLKHWNMVLIILTYASVIFGTFLTRSGVLSSVHSFAESAIGPMFFGFISLTFIASLALLIWRWRELKGENRLHSLLSREALFLLNNLLFMGILMVCIWGLLFPMISELVTGQKVTVGPPFYERATAPLGVGLLLLMAIAPLSVYRRTSWKVLVGALWKPFIVSLLVPVTLALNGITNFSALLGFWAAALVTLVTLYEFWRGARARNQRHGENLLVALWRLVGRNRRRYGGYVIHLGAVMMALGIIGIELFQTETQATLAQGEQLTLGRYVMIYDTLTQYDDRGDSYVTQADVSVYRDGNLIGELSPRQDYYYASEMSVTIPGVRSTLGADLNVMLVGWEPIESGGATFKVFHNPLMNFIWLGGLVFVLGTMVAAWPDRYLRSAQRQGSARVKVARR